MVIPIIKSGDYNQLSSYRPISLLSVSEKIKKIRLIECLNKQCCFWNEIWYKGKFVDRRCSHYLFEYDYDLINHENMTSSALFIGVTKASNAVE